MARSAIYRQIHLSFWTDSKIDDNFTPEDKYFYLYLLTNPHTTLCGCYEISAKQMIRETGYADETVHRLIDRMQNIHNVVRFDPETKEVLLLNWSKYNWTKSNDFMKGVQTSLNEVKNPEFREYLQSLLDGSSDNPLPAASETVCRGSVDTQQTTVAVTVSDTVSVIGYPGKEELIDFCLKHDIDSEFGIEFFDRYNGNGWTMDNGESMRNWRNVLLSAWRKVKKSPSGKQVAEQKNRRSITEDDCVEYPHGTGIYISREEWEALNSG